MEGSLPPKPPLRGVGGGLQGGVGERLSQLDLRSFGEAEILWILHPKISGVLLLPLGDSDCS